VTSLRDTSHMSRSCVGITDPLVVARPTAETMNSVLYLSAAVSRVDAFWVPDHLNALFPRSV
jgi:phthiodiolone/phenolphthiodiolone dimycocerosates ketoreductase